MAPSELVDLFPIPGFNMNDSGQVDYELVSTGVDITDPDEIALHNKAFNALSDAACYGDAAKELISKALTFWSSQQRGSSGGVGTSIRCGRRTT
jgi:hypothetical protein